MGLSDLGLDFNISDDILDYVKWRVYVPVDCISFFY